MSAKNKTIEQKMDELRALVAWFEADSIVLEEAGEKFKQAAALAKEIDQWM